MVRSSSSSRIDWRQMKPLKHFTSKNSDRMRDWTQARIRNTGRKSAKRALTSNQSWTNPRQLSIQTKKAQSTAPHGQDHEKPSQTSCGAHAENRKCCSPSQSAESFESREARKHCAAFASNLCTPVLHEKQKHMELSQTIGESRTHCCSHEVRNAKTRRSLQICT